MIFDDDDIEFLGGQDYHPQTGGDDVTKAPSLPTFKNRRRKKRNAAIFVVVIALLVVAFFAGRYYFKHYYWDVDFDYPVSRSCDKIFSDLQKSSSTAHSDTTFVIDSIDGVPMRFFDLSGFRASIAEKMPSLNDSSIVLITQAWDYYTDDNNQLHYLGEFVNNGNKEGRGIGRAGFVAITNQGWQMGVSQDDSISDYVVANHGSMFRQYALVSSGEICLKQFALKGKVNRRALARKPGSASAYYVETINKESLYDFAQALADDGFIDAVYLTGGDGAEPIYRDGNGRMHGNAESWKEKFNLLVFTRKN